MCPQCEKCTTWTLHNICAYTRISYLFDNPGTVFYAVFMSFWGKYLYCLVLRSKLCPSCDIPGVLEEEERQPGSPVGLHGLH